MSYKPFSLPEYIETDYGTINTRKLRYFTHRKKEHFFKKFSGFGLSISEISLIAKYGVREIVIRYLGSKENIIYKYNIRNLKDAPEYDDEGDFQKIIEKRHLQIIGREVI